MALNTPHPYGNDAFRLNRIFTFPSDDGPRVAVAVSASNADRLISFYALLVKSAIVQLWTIIIIIGVYFSLRQPDRSHNSVVAATGVLNARRPLEVSELSLDYLLKLKRRAPKGLLIWLATAILALAVTAGIPTLVGPYIVVGHGAPVNPKRIYIPNDNDDSRELSTKVFSLEVPSALRAAGNVQSAGLANYKDHVQIDDPEKVGDKGDGDVVNRYGYRYNVTAKEFGLQHYYGLTLHVEGSCITEYGWHSNESGNDADNIYRDIYHLWGDESKETTRMLYGLYDAPMPVAYFPTKEEPVDDGSQRNTSFAILVSSFDRNSFTRGNDPFYLTGTTADDDDLYYVQVGRPVLSCWQSDTWVYKNQRFSITNFNRTNGALSDFPWPLNTIFTRFFTLPKITALGIRLGASALLSAATTLGETIDAGSASMHSDLSRLVVASYIASATTLSDTVLFGNSSGGAIANIPNLIEPGNLEAVAKYVLYADNVRAMSVPALASIPLVWAATFLIAWIITSRSWFPWFYVQGLQATLLYSFLDQRTHEAASTPVADGGEKGEASGGKQGSEHKWKQSGVIAYYNDNSNNRACFVPPKSRKDAVVAEHQATDAPPSQRNESAANPASPDREHANVLDAIAT